MKRQIPSCNRDALTRIFAMRSYTPFLQKPKKKNKEGEENPKTKTRKFIKKPQNKRKKTRLKKNENNNIEFPSNQLQPKLKGFQK